MTGGRRLRGISINVLIPNMITVAALCAGLTAIRFAQQDRWEAAAFAIAAAAFFDGLDGRMARLLKSSSKFGAELDSLSDVVSFGVAPAMVLYFWTMQSADPFGWGPVMLYAVCCALRLARFNTALEAPPPAWSANYFTGVPAPMAAGLVLFPLVMSFVTGSAFFSHPAVVALFLIGVSILMVSRIPTFAFKKGRVPARFVLPFLLGVGLVGAFLVNTPWATLAVFLGGYILSIPLAIRSFGKVKRRAEAGEFDEDDDVVADDDTDDVANVSEFDKKPPT
ncbi:MAG: CDP-diacylglycerol--serine O-phosphatidyltransferase [Rhodospirillales bacterium]